MQEFDELVKTVQKLRSPEGCPWDKKLTLYSLKSDFMEEASELIDALDNKDIENIKEELGDVLLHVVMHSQIASEDGLFNIKNVINDINEKLIRRHPHVFGTENIKDEKEVLKRWEEIKKEEKKGKKELESVLDKIPKSLPTLMKAQKLQDKAAKFGFDWNNIEDVFSKLDEELFELKEAIKSGNKEHISEELGDVLFVMANTARHLKINADESLRITNMKFKKRFRYIEETAVKKGQNLSDLSLEEMEELWQEAKKQ